MSDQEQSPSEFSINTSLGKTSYLLVLIILPLIYYSLPSTYHHLSTTTHFKVNTITNSLSYDLIITLSLSNYNFLGIRLVSVHTSPAVFTVRDPVSPSASRSPQHFVGPDEVTWSGWTAVICNMSGEEYYLKDPMGKYFLHIEVSLNSKFKLGVLPVPVRSTAKCTVELPLSRSSNGVYGGSFGPTKCG